MWNQTLQCCYALVMIKKIKILPRPVLVTLLIVALLLAYLIVQHFVIYTEDAFVKVDTMSTASEVEGRVTAVFVRDNDTVRQNEPLIQIDPTSLGLSRGVAVASLNEAKAALESEQAHLIFLRLTQKRFHSLYQSGALPLQTVDDINSQVLVSEAAVHQQEATIALMKSRLGLAEYNLTQTQIVAKQSGVISSLNTYVGDYLKVGEPLFTIVSDNNWRIIANIKENRLADLHEGQKVIIYLSFHPFHFYTGHIQSIGRGVARSRDSAAALEYIDPTVDWIRYNYRFPVTITLDHPPADLYMGADARVWIVQ